MAETWRGSSTDWLPPDFSAAITEAESTAASYKVYIEQGQFRWTSALPPIPDATLPIETIVGGRRHGLGFLSRIEQVGGIPLERPALIQDRYAWSFARQKLVLAPGCAVATPRSFETAFGIVLSPTFEARCLSCHGQPNTLGAGHLGGVRCESCHGPGSQHLRVTRDIINPAKLTPDDSIGVCAQCHVGLTKFSDPAPDDLLVADQVRAITSSECFIQSGKALTCTTCHNPHGGAKNDEARSITACLRCHSPVNPRHAAVCRVDASGNCLGCHMPSVEMGPLHLVDHLIRVHPEQGVKASHEATASQIQPVREFLRIIVTESAASGEKAKLRLSQREDFYTVARQMSVDPSAPIGGYLGPQWLSQMEPSLGKVAAKLDYGETTPIIGTAGRFTILQRLPRDFQWEARQIQDQAVAQLASGDPIGALEKSQQALRIYPHFLRALMFIGTTLAQSGNVQRGSAILALTTRLYPEDAEALFESGVMLGALGKHAEELRAYRKAIELEPDLLAVYPKLGMALHAGGDEAGAIEIFRQGLRINPLSAELYRDLSLALAQSGEMAGAERSRALANKIDPSYSPQP